ncbi:MAG: hypothetical protein AAF416_14460 [Pseudomonadota bacterium]
MPIGTRVRLASGGPVMLVVDVKDAFTVTCAWPGGEGDFSVVCLDVVRNRRVL